MIPASISDAVTAAEQHSLTVPQAVSNARGVLAKLRELATAGDPPQPETPADPAKVESAVLAYAKRVTQATASKQAAVEMADAAARRFADAVAAASSGWCGELAEQFADAVAELRKAASVLPADLDRDGISDLDAEQFAAFKDAQGLARRLTHIQQARLTVGSAAAEHPVSERPLFTVLDVDAPTTADAHRIGERWDDLLRLRNSYKLLSDAVLWLMLVRTGERLELAELHAVAGRAERFDLWRQAAVARSSTFIHGGVTELKRVLQRSEQTYAPASAPS